MNEMNLNYQEIKNNIRTRFQNMQTDYVAIGYYLRQVLNNELYLEDGYKNIHEFAQAEFGMKKSNVNHCIRINMDFSVGGDSPELDDKYRGFSKSQLQELLYIPEDRRDEITPDMTVREIRELKENRLDVEPEQEPVSILGYPLRVYPEGSLISTPGCGKCDCFSCHRGGCEIRQVDCYCVEAPMGNPFPCTVLNVVENLRKEIGDTCQFVNNDLAYHRAGDGQPVPCCKQCNNPCGYECRRSVEKRHTEEKQQEEIKNIAQDESIETIQSTPIDKLDFSVRTYNALKRAGIETVEELRSMQDVELSKIRNFSQRCMDEVHGKLEKYVIDTEDSDIKPYDSVIEMDNSVSDPDGSVIDADYREVEGAAKNTENLETCCENSSEPEDITYSEIAIRDYLEEEENTLAEYERVNGVEKLPLNLMMRQRMLVKALRLLLENEKEVEEPEDDDTEYGFLKGKEFMSCARNSLSNLNVEISRKAWKAALPSAESLVHYLRLVMNKNTEQIELPVLKNNDQRKEFLDSFHDWPIWFKVTEASEVYYRYNMPDGNSIVICEYNTYREWMARMAQYGDMDPEKKYQKMYLLKPGYRYLHDCLVNKSQLVDYLKEAQKNDQR